MLGSGTFRAAVGSTGCALCQKTFSPQAVLFFFFPMLHINKNTKVPFFYFYFLNLVNRPLLRRSDFLSAKEAERTALEIWMWRAMQTVVVVMSGGVFFCGGESGGLSHF